MQRIPPPPEGSVAAVLVAVTDLKQLGYHLHHVIVVFLEQPQVQVPVAEAHLAQAGQQGGSVLLGSRGLLQIKHN